MSASTLVDHWTRILLSRSVLKAIFSYFMRALNSWSVTERQEVNSLVIFLRYRVLRV